MAFFCVFLLQCLQMDADSDHQRSGNHGEDRGTDKSNDRMKFKNRRKVLRLNSPAPPNGGSDESDGHDSDYVPSSPVQLALQQRASIGRGVANRLGVMPPLTLQPLAALLVGKTRRRRGLFLSAALP